MKMDRAALRRQQLKEYQEFDQKLMAKKLRDRETKTEKFINAKAEMENRNRQF